MVLDKEEHRAVLIELIEKSQVSGRSVKLIAELLIAIEGAKVVDAAPSTDEQRARAAV